MGFVTYILLITALISAVNCAPLDDSTAKSPSSISSASAATSTIANIHKYDSSSEESKDSSEDHKRPSRDTDNSPATAYQTKDGYTNIAQTSAPLITKDVSKPQPQLPSRDTRDTDHNAALSPAVVSVPHPSTYQEVSTSSTTSATTSKSS